MTFQLFGTSFIGYGRALENNTVFTAYIPASGNRVGPFFSSADKFEVEKALELAAKAAPIFGKLPGRERAAFLRKIAENIEALGDELIERCSQETALPHARLQGERGRTCNQLKMFADMLEEGSWVDARIDTADPQRQPVPKPDTRSMLRPIGPVAVFCASNFPLAFSVAGGDTASALAAGCPVIVNSNIGHPGTSEMVAYAVVEAAKECNMPEGTFSLLFTADYEIGKQLVQHENIKAVGFTGSQKGGTYLCKLAAERDEPIPVYAEMGSINPMFLLPGALAERTDDLANGVYNSFTLGAGQFCTKPGFVVVSKGENGETFTEKLKELVKSSEPVTLLTHSIHKNFNEGMENREDHAPTWAGESYMSGYSVMPTLSTTEDYVFPISWYLAEEIFGPHTLLVNAESRESMFELAEMFEGQLTASIHGTEQDLEEYAGLIDVLEKKAGRLIINGYPTGVEVNHSMVHGGAFPASSDSRTTSVGARSIERFARAVCYQDFPQNLLLEELKDDNPLKISRIVNGVREYSKTD